MPLQSMGLKPFAILLAIVAIGPIAAGVALQRQAGTVNHYAFWGILAIAMLTFGVLGFSMSNRSAAVRDGELTVKSTFYSTTVPLTKVTEVRTVVPGSEDDLVGWRVNGLGLPGFRSGWFSSRAGGRLFVDRVGGPHLLISVDGKPRLALEFADNQAATKALAAGTN